MKWTLPLFCIASFILPRESSGQAPSISSFTMVRDNAFGSTWDTYDTTLVAFNAPGADGYHNIYFAHVTADDQIIDETCFTCGNPLLPGKNAGGAVFQPGGTYVAFVAEKAVHPGSSSNSVPGIGTFSDVWFMTRDGQHAYQMTNTPDTGNASGVIFPFFSPDGQRFTWTEMVGPVNVFNGKQFFGSWVIKTANIIDGPAGPSFTNIQTLQPGGVLGFNEGYGWNPDGTKLLFASCYDQFWVWDDQIYEMNDDGTDITQLSQCCNYNEHAFYTPDGTHVVWMTNTGANTGTTLGGDDYWTMNTDGSDRQRLTFFNDTTSAYWTGDTHILGHGCFSPDGTRMIGDVGGSQPIQIDPSQVGSIYIYRMNNVGAAGISSQRPVITGTIFPNPSSGAMTIILDRPVRNGYVKMYNALGEMAYSEYFNGNTATIDHKLTSGLYIVHVTEGRRTWNSKVRIE